MEYDADYWEAFYAQHVFTCLWCNEQVTDETYYPYCCSLCASRADVDSSEPEELE